MKYIIIPITKAVFFSGRAFIVGCFYLLASIGYLFNLLWSFNHKQSINIYMFTERNPFRDDMFETRSYYAGHYYNVWVTPFDWLFDRKISKPWQPW